MIGIFSRKSVFGVVEEKFTSMHATSGAGDTSEDEIIPTEMVF